MKKRILTLLSLTLILGFSSQAQKLKEKDVVGEWKLVIDIEDELEDEADDADTILEEVIIKSVSGLVGGILDNIDIYFEFQSDNDVIITVEAMGESDSDRGKWYINRRGNLVIEDLDDDDDEDRFSVSSDDEWKLIDGVLVSDDHEDDKNVYLERVN